jgi:hydrogenase maturation protease
VIKEIESIGCAAKKVDDKSIKQIAQGLIGSYNGEHLSRIPNEEDIRCN